MIGRLDQKNTLLVIVILCSTFTSLLVMLITFPKTVWIDVPNAGRIAISQMQTSLNDLQSSFTHIHSEDLVKNLYKSQNPIQTHRIALYNQTSTQSDDMQSIRNANSAIPIPSTEFRKAV